MRLVFGRILAAVCLDKSKWLAFGMGQYLLAGRGMHSLGIEVFSDEESQIEVYIGPNNGGSPQKGSLKFHDISVAICVTRLSHISGS